MSNLFNPRYALFLLCAVLGAAAFTWGYQNGHTFMGVAGVVILGIAGYFVIRPLFK